MKIEDLLIKQPWKRRITSNSSFKKAPLVSKERPMQFDTGKFVELSQTDFLNELHPSSHNIHSVAYRSNRVKYKYNTEAKKNVEDGYEEVERVAVGIQEGILRHKVTHTFGNNFWFGSEGKDEKNEELVSLIKSHWNITGMDDAFRVLAKVLFSTADTAIYLYREDDIICYKVFSFEDGDVINMRKDLEGNDVFYRLFMHDGNKAVEIYTNQSIQLWVKINESSFTKAEVVKQRSEDGYELVKEHVHSLGFNPVIYHRRSDVVWGVGQNTIEHIEKLLSDLAENNKFYAYQILFLSGGVMNLPNPGIGGKVIASKSPDGKAEILKPADASNTFSVDLEKNLDLLWETTGTVVIEPKELKAGENTGAFIKNLYWRELQWSQNVLAELRPMITKIIRVFSKYVGIIEKRDSDMQKLRMSYVLEPFVPRNISEEIQNLISAVGVEICSRDTATGELPFSNPRETEKLKKQAEEDAATNRVKQPFNPAVNNQEIKV